MKVVSFINYKGWVGKTTLASNIAADLALKGNKVLCMDLDPQANLTFSFYRVEDWKNNLQNNMTIKKWYDDFVDRRNVEKISKFIVKPTRVNELVNKNLDLICSHLGLINIDLELATKKWGARHPTSTPGHNYHLILNLFLEFIQGNLNSKKFKCFPLAENLSPTICRV